MQIREWTVTTRSRLTRLIYWPTYCTKYAIDARSCYKAGWRKYIGRIPAVIMALQFINLSDNQQCNYKNNIFSFYAVRQFTSISLLNNCSVTNDFFFLFVTGIDIILGCRQIIDNYLDNRMQYYTSTPILLCC